MTKINITKQSEEKDGLVFRVEVIESGTSSEHTVTVSKEDKKRLAPDNTYEELLEASFLFLLDREPKESILDHFNLSAIKKYFPEYEERVQEYF